MRDLKIIVERYSDRYIAYPLGFQDTVVGRGKSYEEAMADLKSAIAFHTETFGLSAWETEDTLLEVFVAEGRATQQSSRFTPREKRWKSGLCWSGKQHQVFTIKPESSPQLFTFCANLADSP